MIDNACYGMRKIGLVLDIRRAASSEDCRDGSRCWDRERLTNRFAARTTSRRYAFCHFLAHPRFGDLADDTMCALTKGKPIRQAA
jgi:hypothetical protein